jgi:hypothetical protein
MVEEDGQLHTLGLLEQLRDQCKSLWGTSSELYFRVDKLLQQLANPNLHDIPSNLQIRLKRRFPSRGLINASGRTTSESPLRPESDRH